MIIVHRHGDCLGNQIATARAGLRGKERDYTIKSDLCRVRLHRSAQPPSDTAQPAPATTRNTPLLTVHNTHHPDQPAEIFHPAMTQMHLPIDIGQQRADRTAIDPGHVAQDIPVHLLQPQTGGKAIQSHRSGQRRANPISNSLTNGSIYIPGRTAPPLASPAFLFHIVDTPLSFAVSQKQHCDLIKARQSYSQMTL